MPCWHNEAIEKRTVKLAFGIPYDILIGVLCHSQSNAERAAEFFRDLARDDMSAVAVYLIGFFSRLQAECDLHTVDLKVRPERRHTPLGFPRPSPARMLV